MKHRHVYRVMWMARKLALVSLCIVSLSGLVGCGFMGGWNFNQQKPGGDPSRPTDLTGAGGPGDSQLPETNKKGEQTYRHTRLAVSKNGRFVLYMRTNDKGAPNYQPRNDWTGFQDTLGSGSLCLTREYVYDKQGGEWVRRPKPLEIKTALWILDLQKNELKEMPLSLQVNKLQVLMHPDGKSFFLITSGCEEITRDSKGNPLANKPMLAEIRQIMLPSYTTGLHMKADPKILDDTATSRWIALRGQGSEEKPLPFPYRSNRLVMSPKGRFLGFTRHTGADKTGHQVYFLDLQKKANRRIELASPLLQVAFAPDESAAVIVGSKEFDTYQRERDAECRKKENATKAACQQKDGWIDVSKIHLTKKPSLDRRAASLGYAVDGHIRIPNAAHGQGGRTATLAMDTNGDRFVIAGCNEINWAKRSCSGKLFVFDLDRFSLDKELPALGPAGFTPDGSALIGWDGTRNERGQVLIPFPFTYNDNDKSKDKIRHKVVLINTKDWSETRADVPLYGPMYFVTPDGNFVVTVSALETGKLVIADLNTQKTTTLDSKIHMAEFAVAADGSTIYTVEQGGVKKLDLKAGTITDFLPAGMGTENINILPKDLRFPFLPGNTKGAAGTQKGTKEITKSPTPDSRPAQPQIDAAKAKLKGTVLVPYRTVWRHIPRPKEAHTDNILVSRFGRTHMEIWSNNGAQLYQRVIKYPKR